MTRGSIKGLYKKVVVITGGAKGFGLAMAKGITKVVLELILEISPSGGNGQSWM